MAQRSVLVRMESPVAARSVQGEKTAAAAGSGMPAVRRASMSASVRPPPADSPATTMSLRSVARAQKRTIDRDGVIHSGWKLIFGREPIVRSKHAKPLERKENSDGTMRRCRAGEVSSPVKIEEHSIVWRRAFEALARDAAELCGRNMDGGGNFVRIGMKDSSRNAIIPHAFQAAFYAPLNDPDRKPGLEAGCHSLPPNWEFGTKRGYPIRGRDERRGASCQAAERCL